MLNSRSSDGSALSDQYHSKRSSEGDGREIPRRLASEEPPVVALPNAPGLKLRMADLHAHRDAFLATGETREGVRPVVRDSWERSIKLGVDPSRLEIQTFDPTLHANALLRSSRLLEHAAPFIDQIHGSLGDEPHIVALADNHSHILHLRSDPISAIDAHLTNLFEGASWAESRLGCNGIGTALATQQPVVLIGPEHFQEAYVGWTCIGIPLRDASGSVVGALDLSVPNAHVQTHTWGWVLSIASAIEIQLQKLNGRAAGDAEFERALEKKLSEFAGPCQAARGVLELIASQVQLSPTHAELVSDAVGEAEEAGKLLKHLVSEVLRGNQALRERDEELRRAIAAAQLQSETSEEKGRLLDALMAYVPEGITIADAPDVRIRQVSEYGRKLTGRSSDVIEGISVDEHTEKWCLFYTDGITPARNEDLPLTRATKKGELVINEEWILERADGARITILCNAGPIRDDDGQITGGLIAWRDISARKQMEHELLQSRNEMEKRVEERTADLAARNRELQNFAYIASHDMREPLRKIQTFGDLMKSDLGERLGEDGFAYLDRINGAAGRMSNLLDDLLAFSRVSTHVRPFQRVSLEEVLDEVRDEHAGTLHELDAELEITVSGIIDADRPQLHHLLSHLVGNAIKYRRDGVRLMMRIYTESDGNAAGETCKVVVEDNGIGIEERFLDRIFEPFQRLHGRDKYGGGTGMGLAICQRIVERHRGALRAESVFGKGSRFVISMPSRQPRR